MWYFKFGALNHHSFAGITPWRRKRWNSRKKPSRLQWVIPFAFLLGFAFHSCCFTWGIFFNFLTCENNTWTKSKWKMTLLNNKTIMLAEPTRCSTFHEQLTLVYLFAFQCRFQCHSIACHCDQRWSTRSSLKILIFHGFECTFVTQQLHICCGLTLCIAGFGPEWLSLTLGGTQFKLGSLGQLFYLTPPPKKKTQVRFDLLQNHCIFVCWYARN